MGTRPSEAPDRLRLRLVEAGLVVALGGNYREFLMGGIFAQTIAFSFAMIWVGVLMGTLRPSVEAVQAAGFTTTFP